MGFVCAHTINVLYLIQKDEHFKMLPERDQDILLWATLLHDVRKRGPPLFEGKDHIHPFTSAEATLHFLRDH
jgi:hypothetical protein